MQYFCCSPKSYDLITTLLARSPSRKFDLPCVAYNGAITNKSTDIYKLDFAVKI